MPKAELKTKETDASVPKFLNSISDEQQRADALKIVETMRRITGEQPRMWGPSIVGFGSERLKYASGRELDWMKVGFSPRKANLTLYGLIGSAKQAKLLEKLGEHTTGKGCLYIKRLSDVDENVLEKLVSGAMKDKS